MAEQENSDRGLAGGCRATGVFFAFACVVLYADARVRQTAATGFRASGGGSGVGGISARMAAHHGAREQGACICGSARQHFGRTLPAASLELCGVETSPGHWREKG